MASELIKAVRSLRNLERAWSVIQRNGRTSKSEEVRLELEAFAEDAPSNLRSLKGQLARGSFKFAPAKGVPIPKLDEKGRKTGKFRPIVLAPVKSRIVQRAILNVLADVPALIRVSGAEGDSVTVEGGGLEDGAYAFGRLRWLTGANAGLTQMVLASDAESVTLADAPAFAVAAGTLAELTQVRR